MRRGHSVWAKYREASKVISLQGLSNDYWNPRNHNFTVLGQSLSPTIHECPLKEKEGQSRLPLESIVAL